MRPECRGRYFDLSTLLALGLATLLLISLPGGCGDNGDEPEDVEVETATEPTPPPMIEIVEPEPGTGGPAGAPEDAADDETADAGPSDEQGASDEATAEEEAHDGTYVVQAGDTLYAIAVRFNVTVDAILQENGITDPNSLQVGQVLQVPSQD